MAKRAKVRNDPVFGNLVHVVSDLWQRPIELPFLGEVRKATLSVNIDPSDGLEPNQIEAYRLFCSDQQGIMRAAETAVREYCERLEEQDDSLPQRLASLVRLEGVLFRYARRKPTFGVLYKCDFDENGIAVKFENGKAVETGGQDIVL